MSPEEMNATPHPTELILELSHNCNLSCIMCGFTRERNRPEYFMNERTLNQVMSAFQQPPNIVRLNGRGESSFHPLFPEFIERIRERWPGATLHLFTNLSIKDSTRVELLRRHKVQLFISLDSPDPAELASIRRGAKWEHIERNLQLLSDHQPRPFVVFTIQPQNLHRLFDIARFAAHWKLGLIYNVVRSDVPDYRLLNKLVIEFPAIRHALLEAASLLGGRGLPCLVPDQIQGVELDLPIASTSNGNRKACPALERETCIQYDGSVTPCNMFHPAKLGHIRQGAIEDVLNSATARDFRAAHKHDPYCRNCAYLGGAE